jgi:molybdate transport system substrate-binding protein
VHNAAILGKGTQPLEPVMRRVLALLLPLFLGATSASAAETINVAAAISLKNALEKAAVEYRAQTGNTVEFTFGSSGQLASQIKGGAPVDLFISAANKQVDDLMSDGSVVSTTRRVVAGNTLVAVVPADAKSTLATLQAMAGADVSRIAIGEPRSVPAGQYAEQALRHADIHDAVKQKLVLGTNVRQVLDYVERGEVSVGLVYATDAKVSGNRVRVAFTVPPDAHEPIVYPAAVVAVSKKRPAAERFLRFLLSESGQQLLKDHGFTSPSDIPAPATRPSK